MTRKPFFFLFNPNWAITPNGVDISNNTVRTQTQTLPFVFFFFSFLISLYQRLRRVYTVYMRLYWGCAHSVFGQRNRIKDQMRSEEEEEEDRVARRKQVTAEIHHTDTHAQCIEKRDRKKKKKAAAKERQKKEGERQKWTQKCVSDWSECSLHFWYETLWKTIKGKATETDNEGIITVSPKEDRKRRRRRRKSSPDDAPQSDEEHNQTQTHRQADTRTQPPCSNIHWARCSLFPAGAPFSFSVQ